MGLNFRRRSTQGRVRYGAAGYDQMRQAPERPRTAIVDDMKCQRRFGLAVLSDLSRLRPVNLQRMAIVRSPSASVPNTTGICMTGGNAHPGVSSR